MPGKGHLVHPKNVNRALSDGDTSPDYASQHCGKGEPLRIGSHPSHLETEDRLKLAGKASLVHGFNTEFFSESLQISFMLSGFEQLNSWAE